MRKVGPQQQAPPIAEIANVSDLAALAAQFPGARLRLDHLGVLFGEATFGPVSQIATAGMAGALFGAVMVWAFREEPEARSLRDRT